jgi:hypothetical protein
MATPQLRIVLVDADHSRRMSIEKNLSCLGYHRVLPVCSLNELFVILDNAIDTFDLVVANEEIASISGIKLDHVLHHYTCVKYSLIYKGVELQVPHSLFSSSQFTASGIPDRPVLELVMSRIEMQF